MAPPDRGASGARTGLAAVGATAFAVGCCAAAPLAIAALGGAALGALLGVAAGLIALTALSILATVVYRRRSCDVPGERESTGHDASPASEQHRGVLADANEPLTGALPDDRRGAP